MVAKYGCSGGESKMFFALASDAAKESWKY